MPRSASGAPDTARRGPAVVVALLAAVGVWATHTLFLRTPSGLALDEAALSGAEIGPGSLWTVASPVLEIVSVPFLIGVSVAAVAMAVIRRRPMLAWQVVVLMAGANLTTQALKATVFGIPGLDEAGRPYDSFPSGHTTVAATVAAALVLVVPVRARPLAALLGATYTALTGVSTLVGGWHRPSDAVAAVLVVLVWACLAMLVGSAARVPTYATVPDSSGRVPGARGTALAAVLLALGAGVTGFVAVLAAVRAGNAPTPLDHDAQLAAYLGGGAGIVAVTLAATLAMVLVLRVTEPVHVGLRG